MLNININETYVATKVHKGTSAKGAWELIVVQGKSRNDRLPIWVQNVPCNIVEGAKFAIAAINGASIKHFKPTEKFDKWQDEFSIDAVVMPVEG